MKPSSLLLSALLLSAGCAAPYRAAAQAPFSPSLDTTIQADNLDLDAYSQWVDGQTKPVNPDDPDSRRRVPQWVLWTTTTFVNHNGIEFGDSKTPGPRHLRIGFKAPVAVGSVLVRGGGTLSVLKPDAVYPGDMGKESDWIPAQRLEGGQLSRAEVEGNLGYGLWVLPPNTQTRALRFTHVASATDTKYNGLLGGAQILPMRQLNLAPLAVASASGENQNASLINNLNVDWFWGAWGSLNRNAPLPESQPIVSPEHPAYVTLTWPAPVKISGLDAIWAGFSVADAQFYAGPDDKSPRDAPASDWKTIKTYTGINHAYPVQIFPNRMDFGETVTTRAVRLKITKASEVAPYHALDFPKDGKRVWLGELMAFSPLGDAPIKAVSLAPPVVKTHPPIPIRFKLDKPGYVTLVIEKQDGTRVRNLVSETPFPAGDNVAWWDGTDDLGRDMDAAHHGIYKIPAQFVSPATYRVRGLVRGEVTPHYEFSVYSPGNPPWETADKTGGWTTNHTPPQAALFAPGDAATGTAPRIYLGSYVAEGGAGLAWVDSNGVKLGGRGWIGGNWTAAPFLAGDNGPRPLNAYVYVASPWTKDQDAKKGELRVTALTDKGDATVLKWEFAPKNLTDMGAEVTGLAVRDGLVAVAMPLQKQILFARAVADDKGKVSGSVVGQAPLEDARGLIYDAQGRLLILVGKELKRYTVSENGELSAPETVIATGLEDPRGITLSSNGNIYISDWGQSHQVKAFNAEGKLFRTIGKAGAPSAGVYDPDHMNNPLGLAIDENNRVWVTEDNYLPKRVSVWNTDGTLWKAFYGPGKYGGGGTIDPLDKTRYILAEPSQGTMEFKLDWKTGESRLNRVLLRSRADAMPLPIRSAAPELPLVHNGKKYYTNGFNINPTNGDVSATIYIEKNNVIQPVAALGSGWGWDLLKTEPFKAKWPQGIDLSVHPYSNGGATEAMFAWSDSNGDGKAQPDEVSYRQAKQVAGVTVMPDLSFAIALVGDRAMRFAPTGYAPDGAPRYDAAGGEVLADGVISTGTTGGNQVLTNGPKDWTVITAGLKPFARESLSGAKGGAAKWSYPTPWPGLHPSHEAPAPSFPGQLIGTTRLIGNFFSPAGKDVGPLWAVNSNAGTPYVFTADGLFVATLFKEFRQGVSWAMPTAPRDLDLSNIALGGENFWPMITATPDGKVYMTTGFSSSVARIDGLDTVRRLPDSEVKIGADDLKGAQTYLINEEATRQKAQGSGIVKVAIDASAPVVDGKIDEWGGADWAEIDKSGVAAYFNSNSKPYDISGALKISGDRLFAAYRTVDANLLQNNGEIANAPFKTGGALDLMIGTDAKADPNRAAPVSGDTRLLVTLVAGKPRAILYRAVVPGATEKVPFSSPWRTITFDEVVDVSDQVQLAGEGGNYEFSVPLSVLGLAPKAGETLSGDLGILRGNGFQTTARVYWSNKATAIVSDVPSEAQLTPNLWGKLEFVAK